MMGTSSWRLGLASALIGWVCVNALACGKSDDGPPPTEWGLCQGSDVDFVQRALLAINGRRAWGEAETTTYVAALQEITAARGEIEARRLVARAMMTEPSFRSRWGDMFMDSLRVSRSRFIRDDKYSPVQSQSCYGKATATIKLETVGPELAAHVRDNPPSDTAPPIPNFSLNMLVGSAIALDDISPIYRAHMLHRMSFPIAGANVEPAELERQRRLSFGIGFEDTYLNRNLTCLGCHNAKDSETPNRTFPLPYDADTAVFGEASAPFEPLIYRSIFRYEGIADVEPGDSGARAPWGWDESFCGVLGLNASIDPLGVDAKFGSVKSTPEQPNLGKLASVWILEQSLSRGFEALRDGPDVDANGEITNPDEAFAYLVASNVVERVWEEVIGAPLSVAHTYPRNQAQRDILFTLTNRFVLSGFSLKGLLADILTEPLFNIADATSSCWEEPYGIEPIMDPFTTDVPEPVEQGNGPGERAQFLSSRVLVSALHQALEWPALASFPKVEEDEVWQQAIGLTLSATISGFRGLDFQARLAWESRYGQCGALGDDDFIGALLKRANDDKATVEDVVLALKDRLIGDPQITDEERAPTEALLNRALESDDLADMETPLRLYCGAIGSSPQFALAGVTARGGLLPVPALTPPEHGATAECDAVRKRLLGLGVNLASCKPTDGG
jgi:hypothetical protein